MFPDASIHGRFQILHNEHFAYFRSAVEKYGRLYIGLTGQGRDLANQRGREAAAQNPLTYWERVEMWHSALAAAEDGFGHIVGPFPIERPDLLLDYVPTSSVCATTVREDWNQAKISRLRSAGYRVDVLYTDLDKQMSGGRIRAMIAAGSRDWVELVPPGVADFLTEIGIEERIRSAAH